MGSEGDVLAITEANVPLREKDGLAVLCSLGPPDTKKFGDASETQRTWPISRSQFASRDGL